MTDSREIILDTLVEILEKNKYGHIVIGQVLTKYDYLERHDKAFIKRVCEGTIEQKIRIDYIIDQYSNTKVEKMKPFIRTLLRMSVYQIIFMDGVPDSAVCNEAVKLSVKRKFVSLKGFVNGVLRTISRQKSLQKDGISYPDRQTDFIKFLSVMYSMPEWIIEMWSKEYGADKTEAILEALLRSRPLIVRIDENLKDSDKEALIYQMKEAGIAVSKSEELPYAYLLSQIESIHRIPGFQEGKLMIQDIGSMMIVEMAGIKEGDFVLDVCAAPGGKTLHAATKLNGTGIVEARDISGYKLNLIEENMLRSPYKNIVTKQWDASVLDKEKIEKADVLIADLPCSGLGVIARKGDIKYRVQKDDIKGIAELQREILDTVSSYVKYGGKMIYSTCTISNEENTKNRDYILSNLPFELLEERLLLPDEGEWDGFYMAAFIKKDKTIENES